MKVVVNRCYGGFGLSEKAYLRLNELGVPIRKYIEQERGPNGLYIPQPLNNGEVIFDRSLDDDYKHSTLFGRYWDSWTSQNRSHPLIIQVVEELGGAASGSLSKLEIVEIPDDVEWEIDDYDGMERVAESHRTW